MNNDLGGFPFPPPKLKPVGTAVATGDVQEDEEFELLLLLLLLEEEEAPAANAKQPSLQDLRIGYDNFFLELKLAVAAADELFDDDLCNAQLQFL